MNFYSKYLHVIQRFEYFTSRSNRISYVYVTAVSSLFIYINIYTLYEIEVQLSIISDFVNSKFIVLAMMSVVAMANYYLFVRHESFDNFSIYKINDFDIFYSVIYLIITVILFISAANHNRERIGNIRKADKSIMNVTK